MVYIKSLHSSKGLPELDVMLLTGCHKNFEQDRLPVTQTYDTRQIGLYHPHHRSFLSLTPMYLAASVDDSHLSLAQLIQITGREIIWKPAMQPLTEQTVAEQLFQTEAGIQYKAISKQASAAPRKAKIAKAGSGPVSRGDAKPRTHSKLTWFGLALVAGLLMGSYGAWRAGWIGQSALSKDPSELIKQGYLAFQKHQYAQAIALYNRCLELDPDYPAAYNNRALVYQAQEKWDAALDDSNKAIALDTGYAVAYSTRGWSYHHKGQTQRGLDDLETSIRLRADSRWPWYYRAEIHKAAGNCQQAQKDYQEACNRGHQDACKQTCP